MKIGRLITKTMTMVVDTGTIGVISAAADRAVIDVSDLTGVALQINQLIDAGTCTLVIEKTSDGINWSPIGAALTEASFPVGANQVAEVALSTAGGMVLNAKQVRVTASALAGGGEYSFGVTGTQRDGYR